MPKTPCSPPPILRHPEEEGGGGGGGGDRRVKKVDRLLCCTSEAGRIDFWKQGQLAISHMLTDQVSLDLVNWFFFWCVETSCCYDTVVREEEAPSPHHQHQL